MTRKLSAFLHKVQRWTTNCFVGTPTDDLAIEACLPPVELLLTYKRRLANLRILGSPPRNHPSGRTATPLCTDAITGPPHPEP